MSLRLTCRPGGNPQALGRSRGGFGCKIVGVCDAADRACDVQAFRSAVQALGATPVVPSRKNATHPQPCPAFIYRHRNLIERCWSRLKEWRAVATRYDKTATSYAAGIAIAATLDWFKATR